MREFSSMPEEFDWDRSTFFAHLIDGYRLAQQEGLGDLQDFYWTILAEAERTGTWSGTTLELGWRSSPLIGSSAMAGTSQGRISTPAR